MVGHRVRKENENYITFVKRTVTHGVYKTHTFSIVYKTRIYPVSLFILSITNRLRPVLYYNYYITLIM